jgi:hypothetical protein
VQQVCNLATATEQHHSSCCPGAPPDCCADCSAWGAVMLASFASDATWAPLQHARSFTAADLHAEQCHSSSLHAEQRHSFQLALAQMLAWLMYCRSTLPLLTSGFSLMLAAGAASSVFALQLPAAVKCSLVNLSGGCDWRFRGPVNRHVSKRINEITRHGCWCVASARSSALGWQCVQHWHRTLALFSHVCGWQGFGDVCMDARVEHHL